LQLIIDDQLFLETLLVQLRGKIISYASKIKRKNNQRESAIENKIKNLDEKIKLDPRNSRSCLEDMEQLNVELEEIRNKKIQGTMIRSKARWYELGEKPTSYFSNLENRNHANKTIFQLLNDDGSSTTDRKEILNKQKTFYENLYTEKNEDVEDNLFFAKNMPH